METSLLILGKGDNVITMILDNLYSIKSTTRDIDIYNNLGLPVFNKFDHEGFTVQLLDEPDQKNYNKIFLGVYQPQYKIKIIETLRPDIAKFINIIHDGSDLSETSQLGVGVLINSKVSVAAHSIIGNFVSINRHVSIGHHTIIDDFCSINPGTNIAGNVRIGRGTTVGMGTNIVDGIQIGKNTIIGAGSVVTKDIPDNVIAYGSPCKIIRENSKCSSKE